MPQIIRMTGESAYPGDSPSTYIMVNEKGTNLLTRAIQTIGKVFANLLPDQGGKEQELSDTGLLIKTSPTIWEYEMFRMEWDRRSILREMDLIVRSDTRIKRANRIFAQTAVRKGITITCTSDISKKTAHKAQDIINNLMHDCQVNAKLASWARILMKEGDLFLNPVIDIHTNTIKTIKRLPAVSMQRNESMEGNFIDMEKAFRQIDPISLLIIQNFPLWAINHIRWDHEEGERYGNSQYLQCRGYWKKLNMTEQDLVVRRRTRAIPRRLHIIGNKDQPGSHADIDNYRAVNHLDANKSQITTDYYMNGLGDIKDLNADAHLDEIDDIKYLQEIYVLGMGVPLALVGGAGRDINRDVLGIQEKQFKEDVQELRDLIEYGDSSPYSGIRAIFDLALALQGVDPHTIEYNVRWAEEDNETPNDRIKRVALARSAQPIPLMSQKTAIAILAKDHGLENEKAIQTELEEIQAELEQDRLGQAALMATLNPQNPTKSSLSRTNITPSSTIKDAMLDAIADDSKKKDYFPLYGKWVANDEQKFKKILKYRYAVISAKMKKHTMPHAEKAQAVKNTLDNGDPIIDEYLQLYEKERQSLEPQIKKDFYDLYSHVARRAVHRVHNEKSGHQALLDAESEEETYVNQETLQYLQEQAANRIKGIDESTKEMLRHTLSEAYENGESAAEWQARIDNIMGLEKPKGRALMIARTEIAWAYSTGLLSGYKEIGVEHVQWLAVMDNRTCPICAARHEKVYKLRDIEGKLPAHPRCRCTIIAADGEYD